MPDSRIYLQAIGCISAAGNNLAENMATLLADSARPLPITGAMLENQSLRYGLVHANLPDGFGKSRASTRTEKLIAHCLHQSPLFATVAQTYDPKRIAVVMGASTSGMAETEKAMAVYAKYGQLPEAFHIGELNLSRPAIFTAAALGAKGPVYTISNACASGSMAYAAAARLLCAGVADAVIAGGVDGASRFTTAGFNALGAISPGICEPFGQNRCGINLGEGGAIALFTRAPAPLELAGWGETCDAHHISSPDPDGTGATHAMLMALHRAGVHTSDIDYISLHGTATRLNDAMEAKAVSSLFGAHTPAASLKPLTGHMLAGAGSFQAVIASSLLLNNPQGKLAVNHLQGPRDEDISQIDLVLAPRSLGHPLQYVLCNAFAFGGSNASLVFRGPHMTE